MTRHHPIALLYVSRGFSPSRGCARSRRKINSHECILEDKTKILLEEEEDGLNNRNAPSKTILARVIGPSEDHR